MKPDYDILLGDHTGLQGYRVRSFVRDSAPLIAPKFSTGAQSQTDLDLLKSKSVDSFAGGMFQREWEESTKAARVYGIYNRYDNNLYPAPDLINPTFSSGSAPTTGNIVAKAESRDFTFIARGYYSSGTYYNTLYKIQRFTGIVTPITLPAAIATNFNTNITGLCLHKNYLYVCGKNSPTGSFNIQKMDLSTNTFTTVGSHTGVTMMPLRGSLYLFNVDGGIYLETNETTTAMVATHLDQPGFGDYQTSPFKVVEEFNGALYFSMADGMYRFDGVKSVKILGLSPDLMRSFNGALYFYASQWLYRFDGANLEKLQYFGEENITDFSATDQRLYIATSIVDGTYSMDDKPQDFTETTLRVYYFDGAAFYLYNEQVIDSGFYPPGAKLATCTDEQVHIIWSRVSDSGTYTDMDWKYCDQDTPGALEFTISDFDDGFPNILKSLESLRLLYSNKEAADTVVVKYQFYDGTGWQSWQTLTSNSDIDIEVNNPMPKLNLRMRANVSVTAFDPDSIISFKGFVMGYTLQPRVRWRWQALLMAEGNASVETRNNMAIDTDSNALTNIVHQSLRLKTPLYLAAPDYARVKVAADAAATTLVFGGRLPLYTDPYGDPVYMAVQNNSGTWEVLRVNTVTYNAGNDDTTVVVHERGYLGITAGAIDANKEMRVLHKVYITRLLRESPELNENVYATQTTGESQLKREFAVEITEV